MPGLEELYQQVILDHYRNCRGVGRLDAPSATVHHHNPMCGDEVTLDVLIEDGRLAGLGHVGEGCSISRASASMMSEALAGRDVGEALALIEEFRLVMHRERETPEALGDAVALEGVAKFPARVKCALLAWLATREAIEIARAGEDGLRIREEVADGR